MKTSLQETAGIEIAVRQSIRIAAVSLALLVAGCGGGGGGSAPAAIDSVAPAATAPQAATSANAFTTTSDNYGMQNPTYLSSTKSALGIVLRVAIASSMTDPNFKTISRVDILPAAAIIPRAVYSLGSATDATPAFPGTVYFFNGQSSTQLATVGGTITFTAYGSNTGDRISGSYSAIIEDGNDSSTPRARYTIAANFDFITDSNGPVLPASPAVVLAAAAN